MEVLVGPELLPGLEFGAGVRLGGEFFGFRGAEVFCELECEAGDVGVGEFFAEAKGAGEDPVGGDFEELLAVVAGDVEDEKVGAGGGGETGGIVGPGSVGDVALGIPMGDSSRGEEGEDTASFQVPE